MYVFIVCPNKLPSPFIFL